MSQIESAAPGKEKFAGNRGFLVEYMNIQIVILAQSLRSDKPGGTRSDDCDSFFGMRQYFRPVVFAVMCAVYNDIVKDGKASFETGAVVQC